MRYKKKLGKDGGGKKKSKVSKYNDEASSRSDATSPTDTSDDESGEDLKPIGAYIKDRREMVRQMLHAVPARHLNTILPDVLKDVSLAELEHLCTEQIEVMSKKRIRYILAGKEMTSSSGTEDSSSSDEGEIKRQSENQNLHKSAASTSKSNKKLIKKSPDIEQPDSTSAEHASQIDLGAKEEDNNADSNENSPCESKLKMERPISGSPKTNDEINFEEKCEFSDEDEGILNDQEDSDENPQPVSTVVDKDDESLDFDEAPFDDLWFEENTKSPDTPVRDEGDHSPAKSGMASPVGDGDFGGSSPPFEPVQAKVDESKKDFSDKEEGEVENYDSDEDNKPTTSIEQPDSTSAEQAPQIDLGANEDDNNIDSNENPCEPKISAEEPMPGSPKMNEDENNCEENVENSGEEDEIVKEQEDSSENNEAENPMPVSTMFDDDEESLDYDEAPLEDLWFKEERTAPDRQARDKRDSLTDEDDHSPSKSGLAAGDGDFGCPLSLEKDPLGAKNDENKNESTDKEEGEVENYDSDEENEPSTSKYPGQELYPPGMEPDPPPLIVPPKDQKLGDLNENAEETILKKTSLVTIKALYNQLKAEKEKKAAKPKVYSAPLPVWTLEEQKKTKIDAEKTPAGPQLPPKTENSDPKLDENVEKLGNSEAESTISSKKSSKKKSNILLTDEFLEDLNRKKCEHELEMAKKAEMLENLKRKRQMLEQEEKETEEMFKKQNDLGIFDEENGQNGQKFSRKRSKTTSRNHSSGSPEPKTTNRNRSTGSPELKTTNRNRSTGSPESKTTDKNRRTGSLEPILSVKSQNDDKNSTLNIEEMDFLGSPCDDLSDFLIDKEGGPIGGQNSGDQDRQISSPLDQKPEFNFKELSKNLSVSVRLSETGDRQVTVNEKADKMRRAFKLSSSSSLEEGEVDHPDKVYGDYDQISSEEEADQLFLPARRQSVNSKSASKLGDKPYKQTHQPRDLVQSVAVKPRDSTKSRDLAKSRDPFDLKNYRKPAQTSKYPKRKFQPDDYDSDFLKRVSSLSDSDDDFNTKRSAKHGDNKKSAQDRALESNSKLKKRKKSSKKGKKRSVSHDSTSSDGSSTHKRHKSGFKQESAVASTSSRVVNAPKATYTQKSTITSIVGNRSISMTSTSGPEKLRSKVDPVSKGAGTRTGSAGAESGHVFEPPLGSSAALLQKLELYELEMRARAIRALMKKQSETEEFD